METPMQALYAQAEASPDLEHWLFSDESREFYQECAQFAEKGEDALRKSLSGEALRVFESYVDNMGGRSRYEKEAYFNRGLAVGIRLATLG